MQFIQQMLPTTGLYCSAQLSSSGGFRHRFFESVEDLMTYIKMMDARGYTMYLAQASYKTTESRKAVNASKVRNFFFDVDCGDDKFQKTPDKAYETQVAGILAIKQFAADLKLPVPSVVNSGNGLYAHWCIAEDVDAEQWRELAGILKGVAAAVGFRQDPTRTADLASVLRPVGTTNRKAVSRPVSLLKQADPLPLAEFVHALEVAARKHGVYAVTLKAPPKTTDSALNAEFMSGDEYPVTHLDPIADKCAQIRRVRDTHGDVDEPAWYNFLGMARFTEEGKDHNVLCEWSSGHPDYSVAATIAKITQHEEAGVGPTSCSKFAADNPVYCKGCKHVGKIKSPIFLGRDEPEAVQLEEGEEEWDLPEGFKRASDGMIFGADGIWKKFYDYPLRIVSVSMDQTLGYEVVNVQHKLPMQDNTLQFSFRSSLVHDTKALLMTLGDNHVQPVGAEARKMMIDYLDLSMAKIRANRRLVDLHSQMGWKDDGDAKMFVLGEQIFRMGEDPQIAGFARNVPEAGRAFKPQGELDEWKKTTKALDMPGMEPFAFAFLAGAFGSPLVKFTGYAGAMVALIGDSGIGKTLLGEWIMSVYGDSQKLILLKDDTRNFLVQRLGLYGSLPIYVDEVSNIDGQELSDLVYKITQGRDKGRLSRNGSERAMINSWNTVAVASSNHSLIDKLSALKSDASAEINRIMEIDAHAVKGFTRELATGVYRNFRTNYGVAGPVYIKYLTDNQDAHRDKIDTIVKMLDLSTDARPDERFWSALTGAAIYGGLVAHKLGLIDINVSRIFEWVKKQIRAARSNKADMITNHIDLLGQFLDAFSSGALVTTGNQGKETVFPRREPRAPLVYRIDEDTQKLYISRNILKSYLEKAFGSYSRLKYELEHCGALLDSNKRKVLGSGTIYSGSQQPVWEIDLTVRELGRKALSVVRTLSNNESAINGARI